MGGVTSVQGHKMCQYHTLWNSKRKESIREVGRNRFPNCSPFAIISRCQGWQLSALNMYWISLKVKNGQPRIWESSFIKTILAPQVLT